MIKIFDSLILRISKSYPELDLKLKQAGMKESKQEFLKKTFISSIYMTIMFILIIFFIFSKADSIIIIFAFLIPIMFFLFFSYFIRLPDVRIIKKMKDIDREIVYAGRFLIIELGSGVLLYEAMANISKSYKSIGKTFDDILHSIDFGTPIEDALNDAIKYTPSTNFRRMMWQIINALKTGADVSSSLKSVVDQITREQVIEIKKYAKKLNPLAMFYMIIAVIFPSLGITMLITMSSFISLELSLSALILISLFLGLLQFMFFMIIKSSRPAVGI